MTTKTACITATQSELFEASRSLPEGFLYTPDLLSKDDEEPLVQAVKHLPFKEFEFHGFVGKRRVVSFGWRYDFSGGGLQKTDDIPGWLLPLRRHAWAFAGVSAADLQQVLVTEYQPGAAIGWHKDRLVFGEVIGISLLSACTFRLRRKAGRGWQRTSIVLQPGSAYLLQGPARTEWEHSIPAVATLRYSITFRNIVDRPTRRAAAP